MDRSLLLTKLRNGEAIRNTLLFASVLAASWYVVRLISVPAPSAPAAQPEVRFPVDPVSLDDDHVKGSLAAPVAMIVYSDFQCPFCATFAREILPDLEARYVTTGKVLLVFRHFPLDRIHPYARGAAQATECAGAQGRFWEMHDTLFRNQERLSPSELAPFAGTLNLQPSAFQACMTGKASDRIARDESTARQFGIVATPTLLFGTVNKDRRAQLSRSLVGKNSIGDIVTVITQLLAKSD